MKSTLRSLSSFHFVSALCAVSFLPFAACSGTTSDPKTVVKGDLNPPFELQSITTDKEMILQWNISNTEKDLAGFNVYVAEASFDTLKAKLPSALQSRYNLATSQFRRCDGTKSLFKVFGFSDTDKFASKSCDDFTPESSSTTAAAPSTSSGASDGGIAAAADASKTNFVKCVNNETKADIGKENLLSVDITKAPTPDNQVVPTDLKARVGSTIKCRIAKDTVLSDGSKGFTNGKKYVAFVFAVQGDSADKISYSSNFVEDVPASYYNIPLTLAPKQYTSISLQKDSSSLLTGEIKSSDNALDCPTPDATSFCKINRSNGARSADDVKKDARVFFFSDVQSGSERLLVAGEKDQVFLAPQTPRANMNGKPGIYVPGDSALVFDPATTGSGSDSAASGKPYQSGRNLVVYPGSMFSIVVLDGAGKIHYGKIYLDSLTTTATDSTPGTKTFSVYAAVQTAIEEVLVEGLNPLKVGGLY